MAPMRLLRLLASLSLASGCALVGYDLDAVPDGAVAGKGDGSAAGGGAARDADVDAVGTGQPDGGVPLDTGAPDATGQDIPDCRSVDPGDPRACRCEPKTMFCKGDILVACDAKGGIGSVTDCSARPGSCEVGRCDPEDGCSVENAEDDTACDDGMFCTTGETCQDGVCGDGDDKDCSAKDSQCTLGSCDEDADRCKAVPTHEGLACDDGSICTLGDKCGLGMCKGARMDCSSHDGVCKAGACDEESGACISEPLPNGTSCADAKICDAGACTPGQACGLGQQCMIGCDPATSCVLQCSGAKDCEANCAGGATCAIDCSFSNSCQPTCTTDSNCSVNCRASSDCGVVCDASSCNIDCTLTGQCDEIECTNGAACILSCGANPNCGFKTCWAGDPTNCGGGTAVCGRACD